METIQTDVLVIGGGGAGMQAALAARECGSEVLVVSKTPTGKSTCTYLSGGGFSVGSQGFSKEDHLEATLQAGKGLNCKELVHILAEEASGRIRELEGLGLVGKWGKGRFFVSGKAPCWGAPLTDLLAASLRSHGISELPWGMVFNIVKEGGKVIGALGYDWRTGKTMAFQSKAIILASGGGGALYRRHDNPVRITGDGYALAFHAGCSLRDMEFVQFMPPGLAEPRKPIILIAGSFCDAGKIVNSAGEEVLEKYKITERPVAVRARDRLSLAIFKEEMEGRTVFLDLRALTDANWPKDNMAQSQHAYIRKGLSCQEKLIRISPMAHFFMGGVAADPDGTTEIPGLYAAGEVAGGLHGANRMGGNALDEVVVFGRRAGVAAAGWAKKQS
ncbi:MAG: FAD-binding protein, partial [Deltaproteobacteria bacterium]|nr:FAD-binding protein [Deltaproteobacteria bacterium]